MKMKHHLPSTEPSGQSSTEPQADSVIRTPDNSCEVRPSTKFWPVCIILAFWLVIVLISCLDGVSKLHKEPYTLDEVKNYVSSLTGSKNISVSVSGPLNDPYTVLMTVTTDSSLTFHVREKRGDNTFNKFYTLETDYSSALLERFYSSDNWRHLSLESEDNNGLTLRRISVYYNSSSELRESLEELRAFRLYVNENENLSFSYQLFYQLPFFEDTLTLPHKLHTFFPTEESLALFDKTAFSEEYYQYCLWQQALGLPTDKQAVRNIAFYDGYPELCCYFILNGQRWAHSFPSVPLPPSWAERSLFGCFCLPDILSSNGISTEENMGALLFTGADGNTHVIRHDIGDTNLWLEPDRFPMISMTSASLMSGLLVRPSSDLNSLFVKSYSTQPFSMENADVPKVLSDSSSFLTLIWKPLSSPRYIRITVRSLSGRILQKDVISLTSFTAETGNGQLTIPLTKDCLSGNLVFVQVELADTMALDTVAYSKPLTKPLCYDFACLPKENETISLCIGSSFPSP